MRKISLFVLVITVLLNVTAMAQKKSTEKQVRFVIHTEFGDMKGFLYNETPKHRDNFVKIVKDGLLDGTLFHRVINGFMIQGGDPNSKNAQPGQMLGNGGPNYTIDAEFNPDLIHKKGALAAARTENPKKASSGSQFYIVQGQKVDPTQLPNHPGAPYNDAQKETYKTVGGTPHLDMGYTVFGQITEGLDIIDKIAAQPKDRNDRPLKDVKMTVKIIQ
ncbi:MAG: peptidylprolyl isomerase [Bacteroidetes bacterium]|nr:peptidylprolyl isomerase [Bacteroidota bacterium]